MRPLLPPSRWLVRLGVDYNETLIEEVTRMDSEHSLFRQLGLVRQALEDSRRPIGILLGAGVSSAIKTKEGKPLIPDISAMTALMKEALAKSASKNEFEIVLKQLVKANPKANIEDFLTYVRTLREVADKAELQGLTVDSLAKLDEAIADSIRKETTVVLPSETSAFDQLAVWIRAATRQFAVEVFTLNYDLLVEQALERNKVPYFDGFLGSREAFFDVFAIENESKLLPSRWARLWKLHGSINWWSRKIGESVEVLRSEKGEGDNSLIHPSHLKYDQARQMPYLAMLDQLKRFLSSPGAVLVTCGYSFRDLHVNALIAQTLAGQNGSVVFAFMRSPLIKYPGLRKTAESVPGLNVFSRDMGIVSGKTGKWAKNEEMKIFLYGMQKETIDVTGKPEEQLRSTLGDFVEFGKMLHDLTGSLPITPVLAESKSAVSA